MCTLFANLYMLLTWGPHMVYHEDPIYILHLYNHMWLVGISRVCHLYGIATYSISRVCLLHCCFERTVYLCMSPALYCFERTGYLVYVFCTVAFDVKSCTKVVSHKL